MRDISAYCSISRRKRACGEAPDPYYGGSDGFERVLDLVEMASEELLLRVRAGRQTATDRVNTVRRPRRRSPATEIQPAGGGASLCDVSTICSGSSATATFGGRTRRAPAGASGSAAGGALNFVSTSSSPDSGQRQCDRRQLRDRPRGRRGPWLGMGSRGRGGGGLDPGFAHRLPRGSIAGSVTGVGGACGTPSVGTAASCASGRGLDSGGVAAVSASAGAATSCGCRRSPRLPRRRRSRRPRPSRGAA